MSKQINRYYVLGKIFEQPIDYDLVSDFVEQYVNIAQKKGLKPADVIQGIKNASWELSDAIVNASVNLQGKLPSETNPIIDDEWVLVDLAAKIYAVTPATIRNWTKRKTEPLQHKKLSARKTVVSTKDIKRFTLGPKYKQ
jgi:hypothetical protein